MIDKVFKGKDKKLQSETKRTNQKAAYLRELCRIFDQDGLDAAIKYLSSPANPDYRGDK